MKRSTRLRPAIPPLTPDFTKAVVVRVEPDTRVERTLYRLLLKEQRKVASLTQQVNELIRERREAKTRGQIRRIAAKLQPSHNDTPKESK
jgi:hypothetical protein